MICEIHRDIHLGAQLLCRRAEYSFVFDNTAASSDCDSKTNDGIVDAIGTLA